MKDRSAGSAENAQATYSGTGADTSHPDDARTRAALHALRESLGNAWGRARAGFSAGGTPRSAQSSADAPQDSAAFDTDSNAPMHDVFGDFGKLGAAVAEDTLALAQEWGVSVSDLVRRHPVRSVLIAALAGAAIGVALRVHRKPDDEA